MKKLLLVIVVTVGLGYVAYEFYQKNVVVKNSCDCETCNCK